MTSRGLRNSIAKHCIVGRTRHIVRYHVFYKLWFVTAT